MLLHNTAEQYLFVHWPSPASVRPKKMDLLFILSPFLWLFFLCYTYMPYSSRSLLLVRYALLGQNIRTKHVRRASALKWSTDYVCTLQDEVGTREIPWIFTGQITSRGSDRGQGDPARPVRFENLLARRDPARRFPRPHRSDPTPGSTREVLKNLLIRPASRVMTLEKLCQIPQR